MTDRRSRRTSGRVLKLTEAQLANQHLKALDQGAISMVPKVPQPKESRGEAELALQLRIENLPPPQRELRFHPERKWRFDFAWPEFCFAVEIEGITAEGGRHQRIAGFQGDLEKYDEAERMDWRVYRCSPAMVKSGRALETIKARLHKEMRKAMEAVANETDYP